MASKDIPRENVRNDEPIPPGEEENQEWDCSEEEVWQEQGKSSTEKEIGRENGRRRTSSPDQGGKEADLRNLEWWQSLETPAHTKNQH